MSMYSSLEGTAKLDEVNGLPNVGQYGWTSFEIENYKQLIDYVNTAKQYADEVKASREYIDSLVTVINSIKGDIDSIYAKIQGDKQIIKQYFDTINGWYTQLSNIRDEIIAYRNEVVTSVETNRQLAAQVADLHQDVQTMKAAIDISERNTKTSETNAKTSETNALTYYNKCYELYLELKQGQVYRGIWNPNTNAYPNPEGMNSYWDVILDAGQDEVQFDGKRWFFGDRLLYAVIDNTYYQSQSGATTVKSVNGKNGAVILNADDVKAFPSTSVDSLDEDAIPWNAKTGIYNARSDRHTRIVAHFFQGVASSTPSLQIKAKYNNQGLWYRSSRDAVGFEQGFTKIYTERDKPTPSEIGAVSKTGDTMSGALIINGPDKGLILNTPNTYLAATGDNLYVAANNGSGGRVYLEGKADPVARINGVNRFIYHEGRKPTASDVGAVSKTGDTITGTLNSVITNNTYSFESMGNDELDSKKYIRRFRSSKTATIWHETVQGSTYRLAAGSDDSVDVMTVDTRGQMSLAGQRVYTTGFKPTSADVGAAPGGFGLGELARNTTAQSQDKAGWWRDTTIGTAGITMPYDGTPSQSFIGVEMDSGKFKFGARSGPTSNPIAWRYVYSENNKPTAADVGAADITSTASDIKILATANADRAKEVKIYSKDNNLYTIGQDGTVAKFYNDRTYRPTAGDFGGLFVDNGNEVNFPLIAGRTALYFNYRQQGASAVDKIIFSNAKSQLTGRAEVHAKEFFAEGESKVYHENNLLEIPTPDVWAPLSNNLNLITGYGDEIQVGGYTVANLLTFSRASTATYIDKSGELRTAKINEPRFEKEGLLIEGESTNLILYSEDFTNWSKNGNATITKSDGVFFKIVPAGINTGCYNSPGNILTVGKTYTVSFWAYADANTSSLNVGVEKESQVIHDVTTTPTRYSITFVAKQTSGTIIAYGGLGNSLIPFYVGGFQLEESPFASSYIPTGNARATRSADVCYLNYPQNLPKQGDNVTVYVKSNLKLTNKRTTPSIVGISIGDSLTSRSLRATIESNGNLTFWAGNRSDYASSKIRTSNNVVLCIRDGESVTSLNGEIIKKPVVNNINSGYYIGFQTGHIKDLKIWHSALDDSMIKRLN